ncbi:uncharacterized protein LOC121272989 [Carcharodon carcharias]|uniref:uncharacterized protein LOC121272989 n=1 Tax=Carcharodon carcharias TaxID=13397 RepID=UPI001B7D9575|nr:uncharacterized protein LOC121272989 [Carcharodon carcharias]XP_041035849.1 uncharacterized protein LOC121272989 [Carcharodon carcharias]
MTIYLTIYINDLDEETQSDVSRFADDTTPSCGEDTERLQRDIGSSGRTLFARGHNGNRPWRTRMWAHPTLRGQPTHIAYRQPRSWVTIATHRTGSVAIAAFCCRANGMLGGSSSTSTLQSFPDGLPERSVVPHLPMDSQEKPSIETESVHIGSEHVGIGKASWIQWFYFLHVQKKKWFILLSFVFCFVHFGILCNDIIAHSVTESFLSWSHAFTVALLMSHVASFYWAILGAIYSMQGGVKHLYLLALSSAVLNFWVFLGRTLFELEIIKFREEVY